MRLARNEGAPPVGKEPFGLFTFRAPEGMLWRKWRGIEADMAREQAYSEPVPSRCGKLPASRRPVPAPDRRRQVEAGRARLEEANRAVNMAIRYVSDYTQHGEADRWSAPLASFATAKGDCEDYAIAKYVGCARPAWRAKICSWCWSVTAPSGRIMRCWLPASTIAG